MLKKTLIATATAGMLAVGALGATTTAASAGGPGGGYGSGNGSIQFGGPGWNLQFGFGGGHPHVHHPKKFCKPVFKKVKWWDYHGKPHWKTVVVGQKCSFGPGYPGGPGWHGPHPGPGWGGW